MKFNQTQVVSFLESNPSGSKWKVMIIEEGLSKNGKFYTEESLRNAIPLFEKSKVNFYEFNGISGKKFFNHLPLSIEKKVPQGFPLQTAGFFEDVKFEEINEGGRIRKGLTAHLHFLENSKIQELKQTLLSAWDKGLKNFLGLSINADGKQFFRMLNGVPVAVVKSIKTVFSTDLVSQPAAGGGLLKLVESLNEKGGNEKMFKKLLEMLAQWKPKLLEGIKKL